MREWGVATDSGKVLVSPHEGTVTLDVHEDHSYAPGMAGVFLTPEQARNLAAALLEAAGARWLVCADPTYYPSVEAFDTADDARTEYADFKDWASGNVYLALVVESVPGRLEAT